MVFEKLLTRAPSIHSLSRPNYLVKEHVACFCANAVKKTPPWKILYYGSDHYSTYALEPILDFISSQNPAERLIHSLSVASRFSHPTCELAKFAKRKLPVESHVEYDPNSSPLGYDLGLVASFGALIPEHVIKAFPYGMLCIHPSLLPRWRGAAPLPRTILNGDVTSGVSLMEIAPRKFDVGHVIGQKPVELKERYTSRQLGKKLMAMGVDLLLNALKNLPESLAAAEPQAPAGITYARKVKIKETFVDWTQTADQLDRFYRAFHEDFGIRTYWDGKVIKLGEFSSPDFSSETHVEQLCSSPQCGELFFHKKRNILYVRCADGWVGVGKLMIPNRKPMTGKDFYNGFLSPNKNGKTIFETTTMEISEKRANA